MANGMYHIKAIQYVNHNFAIEDNKLCTSLL